MKTRPQRQRIVSAAIPTTQGTTLAPKAYELVSLELFTDGVLTIEKALALLDMKDSKRR